MEKLIIGLDVGVNSVGWAVVQKNDQKNTGKILGAGSRIIPMDNKEIGDFNKGNLESAASQRTTYRGARRLKQRQKKRRERLVSTLKIMGFIEKDWNPNHRYSFAFSEFQEKSKFKFQEAYFEMKKEILAIHPKLKSVTHDWVIYYLRKKALNEKISKQELAWIILQFNSKRGYFQLRDDKELKTDKSKFFISSIVDKIEDTGELNKGKKSLKIHLRDEIIGDYYAKEIPNWLGKSIEFIATEKKLKDGSVNISFTTPNEDDWTLRKKKTESLIKSSRKTVGAYIYDKILENPFVKIRGKEVHTIDRIHYKNELIRILNFQSQFHPEFQNVQILEKAAFALYKRNEAHRENLIKQGLIHLIVEDILYYQRPLKSKKYLLADCKYESYNILKDGKWIEKPVKVCAKSHPLFQEFRIWEVIHNLKILEKEVRNEKGILLQNVDRSTEYLTFENKAKLYQAFIKVKTLKEVSILKALGLKPKQFTINYPAKTEFKGHELIASITNVCKECDRNEVESLINSEEKLTAIWHALYSLTENKEQLTKALSHENLNLSKNLISSLVELPGFDKDYCAFSVKALKKLVPLMRCGKYFKSEDISKQTSERIEYLLNGEEKEDISLRSRELLKSFSSREQFQGLSTTLASYVVYDEHSESTSITIFKNPLKINVNDIIKAGALRNPVAEKIIREAILIVRDIWLKYGKPTHIHVELAREMKLNKDQRKKYTEKRDNNFKKNQRAKALLKEIQQNVDSNVNPYSKGHLDIIKLYEEVAIRDDKTITADIKKIINADDPKPTDIKKYRIWLEQKYRSPYTGNIIPLSKLFTPAYEIEHVIPRSLFNDDSFNNKIICEASINKSKGNRTAYEMICNSNGSIKGEEILTQDAYENLIKDLFFNSNKSKYNKLMQYEATQGFSSSQLNTTRYINRKLLEYLDPFVREEGEKEAISKNIIPMQGGVTNELKKDWGLHDKWKELLKPRFERMNKKTGTTDYIKYDGNRFHLYGYEKELKRLDHRHHALDAIIIACVTRSHINYKNSLSSKNPQHSLRDVLLEKGKDGKYKNYKKPWTGFTNEAAAILDQIIISFKYNNRVINKTINYYQKYVEQTDGTWKKMYVKQEKNPDHWAIRNAIHQETVYGKLTEKTYKKVSLSKALKEPNRIANKGIRKEILKLYKEFNNEESVKKYIKKNPLKREGEEIIKVDYIDYAEYATSKILLNDSITLKQIESIIDKSIKQDIYDHIEKYKGDIKEAFSENGLIDFNNTRLYKIEKIRVKQDFGIAKPLGENIPKNRQIVKGAKGTNLYYTIYEDIDSKQLEVDKTSTVPFMDVIDAMKDKEEFVIPKENKQHFTVSPGDLVYVFNEGEERKLPEKLDIDNIYKCVSFSKQQCFFIPHRVSNVIENKVEFDSLNKLEISLAGTMIKRNCIKLSINRLGHLI